MSNYLTQDDVQNYGSDLIDFTQRAATDALSPHLLELERSNAELQRRLAREARARLDERVETAVPNYREIDRDPAWHEFLRTVEPMAGRIRQVLLNDAIAQGDAARVISFFHKFQQDNRTSHSESRDSRPPGRRNAPSGQPTYTRKQIAALYSAHRQGAYAGREAEWDRQEWDIVRAGAEGRVVDPDFVTK